ncbi:MAG: DUF5681 domain-containing protein [Proteobacteria bacterium]|nr:DUF5681 domain-containing protein [Pseudomonadota bacterium]
MASDDDVGYGRPPKKSRWKSGQSGNLKGRPRNAKNIKTVVEQEAYATIKIKEGGKTGTVTKVEALMKSMMAKGIKGDTKAASIAWGLLKDFLPHEDPQAAEYSSPTEEELNILYNHADFLEAVEKVSDVPDES